jgi:hypothetical protein
MTWPDDPKHYYHMDFDTRSKPGEYLAFVTIQTVRIPTGRPRFFRRDDEGGSDQSEDRALSRLAVRLDLPEPFRSRDAARNAAYEAARRYAAGQLSATRFEIKKRQGDYQLIGGAGFRPDVMKWEPTLTIRRNRGTGKGAAQTFEEQTSPFRFNVFNTRDVAAEFAIGYGERMLIGLVAGLRI